MKSKCLNISKPLQFGFIKYGVHEEMTLANEAITLEFKANRESRPAPKPRKKINGKKVKPHLHYTGTDDHYCEVMGNAGETYSNAANLEAGLDSQHRDFNQPESHSGTDVTVKYGNSKAVIEVKNLALNLAHRCSANWVLNEVINRIDFLDGNLHILEISYRNMLSKPAQTLLAAYDIQVLEIGYQVQPHNQLLQTTYGRQQRTNLGQQIKSLLITYNNLKITTQTVDESAYTGSLEPTFEEGLTTATVLSEETTQFLYGEGKR